MTLVNTANYLVSKGHDISICEWHRIGVNANSRLDERVKRLYIERSGKWDIGIWVRMVSLLLRLRPTIVHGADFTSNLFSVLCGRLSRVHAIVVGMHGVVDAFVPWKVFIQRFLYRFVHKIHCVSWAVAKKMRTEIGVPDELIKVIYNGVDLDLFEPKSQSNQGPSVVGCVGDFYSRVKGHNYLIESLPHILAVKPNTALWLVGDGVLRFELERKVQELGVEDNVIFCGRQENVAPYYRKFDVLVLPSISEAFGLVLIEAMATGIPVVASKVEGPAEIIEDKENGTLVPPCDSIAIAEAVVQILEDKCMCERYVKNGIAKVRGKFSCNVIGQEYEDLYFEILRSINRI